VAGGERQWCVGRGGWQSEATGDAALLSPSCGMASSTMTRHLPGDGAVGTGTHEARRGEGIIGSAAASLDSAVGAAQLRPHVRKRLNGMARAGVGAWQPRGDGTLTSGPGAEREREVDRWDPRQRFFELKNYSRMKTAQNK
jgi:hypothetical protein